MGNTLLLLPAILIGCGATEPSTPDKPPVGLDLGSAVVSTRGIKPVQPANTGPADTGHQRSGAGEVPGHGTIDAIDPGRRRVILSHDPMPAIGWPAMTMVFSLPAGIDPSRFKPGDHVDFTMRKGSSGSYDLIGIRPGDH